MAYQPIENYGVIGDMHTVALVGMNGSHVVRFAQSGPDTLLQVAGIVMFTIPGVIIGGQVGPAIAKKIPDRVMELSLGVLFIGIAALTIGEVVL